MTTPEEYHQFLFHYNWDDGVRIMRWIVNQDNFDLGTASKILWMAQPVFHARYRTIEDYENYDKEGRAVFRLIHAIVARFKAGSFTNQNYQFNPRADDAGNLDYTYHRENWATGYEEVTFPWDFPPELVKPTPGEPVAEQSLYEETVQDLNDIEKERIAIQLSEGQELLKAFAPGVSLASPPVEIIECVETLVDEYRAGNPRNLGRGSVETLNYLWSEQLRREYGWSWKVRDREVWRDTGMFSPDEKCATFPPSVIAFPAYRASEPNKVKGLFQELARWGKKADFSEAFGCGWLVSI